MKTDLQEELCEEQQGRRRAGRVARLPGNGQRHQLVVHQSLQQTCHTPLHIPYLQQ